MWLDRKQKNRRLKRDNVLDVKLRSDQVRAQRVKLATSILAVCCTLGFGLLILWRGGQWLMDKLVFANDAFAIRQVMVDTDGVIAPEQLRRWSGVHTNDNLLALDMLRVKRDLELVPAIRSVAVERVLPGTLMIHVNEREPVAQVYTLQPRVGGGYEPVVYYLDGQGYVMLPLDPRLRARNHPAGNDYLPTITGVVASEMRPGHPVDSLQIKAALQLVQGFEASPMVGLVDIGRIDLSTPDALRLTTGQGNEVLFGLNDVNTQLRRWRIVYDVGLRLGKSVQALDLSVTNNLPARWAEADGTLSTPVKQPVKTPRTRKKNV